MFLIDYALTHHRRTTWHCPSSSLAPVGSASLQSRPHVQLMCMYCLERGVQNPWNHWSGLLTETQVSWDSPCTNHVILTTVYWSIPHVNCMPLFVVCFGLCAYRYVIGYTITWLFINCADVITQGRLLLLANQDKPNCHIEDPLLEQFITHPTLHTNYTQSPMITSCSDMSLTTTFTTSTGSTQCTVTHSTHTIEPRLYINHVTSTPNAAASSCTDKTVKPLYRTDNTLSTALKVQAFAEKITGISVPRNCIFLSPLLEENEEQQANEHKIEIEDEKVESLTANEEFGIGQQWVN